MWPSTLFLSKTSQFPGSSGSSCCVPQPWGWSWTLPQQQLWAKRAEFPFTPSPSSCSADAHPRRAWHLLNNFKCWCQGVWGLLQCSCQGVLPKQSPKCCAACSASSTFSPTSLHLHGQTLQIPHKARQGRLEKQQNKVSDQQNQSGTNPILIVKLTSSSYIQHKDQKPQSLRVEFYSSPSFWSLWQLSNGNFQNPLVSEAFPYLAIPGEPHGLSQQLLTPSRLSSLATVIQSIVRI